MKHEPPGASATIPSVTTRCGEEEPPDAVALPIVDDPRAGEARGFRVYELVGSVEDMIREIKRRISKSVL